MATTSESRKNIEGWRQRMPIAADTVAEAEAQAAAGRDYVILGMQSDWSSAPVSLTVDGVETRDVAKEGVQYMSRGWRFAADGTYDGTARLEDGTEVLVTVDMQSCF